MVNREFEDLIGSKEQGGSRRHSQEFDGQILQSARAVEQTLNRLNRSQQTKTSISELF